MAVGTVLQLWRWPVKSMGGERGLSARMDERGLGGDRTHAVEHEHEGAWKPLTAREAPRLLAWQAGYPFARGAGLRPEDPPCRRCAIPTRDPVTQANSPQLLRHLDAHHERCSGINARVVRPGRVEHGEAVEVVGT